jgi:hypothetical protein
MQTEYRPQLVEATGFHAWQESSKLGSGVRCAGVNHNFSRGQAPENDPIP